MVAFWIAEKVSLFLPLNIFLLLFSLFLLLLMNLILLFNTIHESNYTISVNF